jgi:acetyl/propionyl-CoA carboxylase alpha subunit/acetyl-CoA carboxylase carboxyltransferase component
VPIKRLLVANRGEIAVRVMHTAIAMGVPTVAVAASDDRSGAHLRWAGQVESLEAEGPAAYLDQETLLAIAARCGCDAVHPGYGFLSERADFAARCEDAGLVFVGASPGALELFGNKVRARNLARDLGLDVLAGTGALTGHDPDADAESVRALLAEHGPVMVKAVAGGGGRGIQPVREADDLADVLRRCRSEAASAFGEGTLYAERLLPAARHIEVQLIGDHQGTVRVLGDRDCSLQRRRQKLVEIAPAPGLSDPTRRRLWEAAVALGEAAPALGLATAEFLVTEETLVFLEVNPRLQVEHTVTEQITGLDLVELQLQVADRTPLADLRLDSPAAGPGTALQARVNAERVTPDGTYPGGGRLSRFAPPTGRGVRVDTHCGPGYEISPSYDSLLAKVITTGPDQRAAMALAQQALAEFDIAGSPTNLGLLRALLDDPSLWAQPPHTDHLDTNLPALLETAARLRPDEEDGGSPGTLEQDVSSGMLRSPMAGVIVEVPPSTGDRLVRGAPAVVVEAMKMEHVVNAPRALLVRDVLVSVGDTVTEGTPLLRVEPTEHVHDHHVEITESDLERIRDDLAESTDRHRRTLDEGRPDAVRTRHDAGRRTARENVEDLCDPGTFVEYGALAVAAQRRRRSMDDLVEKTPGDGMVTGTARVSGIRCAVLSYDYTVLAGTQGVQNHRKTDRLLELARRERLPVVLFAEGGGGRPGDTDQPGFSGLDVLTFHTAADLSGVVPTVAVVGGYCFAGNTALAAVCDVLIATEGSSIGMGGPAMISGGGLGDVSPDEVGPMSALYPNGVVDVLVPDDASAVTSARRYLSYLGGPAREWSCADQRLLRTLVPENRVRTYPIRPVLETLFDTGSVFELRGGYGAGMITAFARLEGTPVGVFANNPGHLGGAIDAEAAATTAWFLRLCDSYRLPVVSLCDTPGFMVGPAAEREGTVEQAGQMFIAGAKLRTQLAMVVLRKGYGLAAMAMAGGALRTSSLAVGWPTGEFGGMNLEGAVRLGYRKELAAIEDPEARQARFEHLVARAYRHGKALTTATVFDIDDVIDPADTRSVLALALGLPRDPGTTADA